MPHLLGPDPEPVGFPEWLRIDCRCRATTEGGPLRRECCRQHQYVSVRPTLPIGTKPSSVLTVLRLELSTRNCTPARSDQLPKSAGMNLSGTVNSGPPEK